MSNSDISLYLKENLKYPSLDFNWSDQDNDDFFTFINRHFSNDYLKERENLLEIKQAFKDYFEPVGYILFQIKNFKIKLKVFPYQEEPQNSQDMDRLVDIICENEEFVQYDYNGRSDQILIQNELKDKIFAFVKTLENERMCKKEFIKIAVRKSFELEENDIVMIKTESIFIKLCESVPKREILESEKNTIANRYNGIDEKSLSDFNAEHFSNKNDRIFFIHVAKIFVDKYIVDKKINNNNYEKYAFAYVLAIITQQLIATFDNCEEFFKGLAGYIFRIHFEEVFANVADAILAEVAISNPKVIDFLQYYSLNTVVEGGVKYKVPIIEAQKGLKWNVVSMLSIVKLYIKTRAKYQMIASELTKMEEETIALSKDGLNPVEFNKINMEEIKQLTNELIGLEREMEKYYDSLHLAKDEKEKLDLQEEIALIKKEAQDLRKANKTLSEQTISRVNFNKYLLLEKELNSTSRRLKRENKILEQNEESFSSIKTGLVKALISKKQQI